VRRSSSPADPGRATTGLVVAVLALIALGHAPPATAGSDQPAGKRCVAAEEASVRPAGDSGGENEGAPPKFTPAFYARTFTLDTSLDGIDGGKELPISIEEVCGVPKALRKQAAQLAGADGIALLLPKTTFWQGETQLEGSAATTALDGADTAVLRGRLARPTAWGEDEDGGKVATLRTGRVEITD
jgi:hypothetical protein